MDDKIVVKYYCPLSVSLWDKNGEYGWDGEPEIIDSNYAAEFCNEIESVLDAYNDVNMHEYFDGDVAKKLNSVVWGVEVVRGVLYGCITVELNDFLTQEEEADLKDQIEGQNSDGFGESFEQSPIEVPNGEVYVSFWERSDNYFMLNQGEFAKRLGAKQPYGFSYKETEKCRNYWWHLKPGEREVVAVLDLMGMSIELNLEMSDDGVRSAHLFKCTNFENTGWDSDDYIAFDVEGKLSSMTSWQEVEDYLYEVLMKHCEDNGIDYTRLSFEDNRAVADEPTSNDDDDAGGLTVNWLMDALKQLAGGKEMPIEFQSYEWDDDLESLSYHKRFFETVYEENGKIVIQLSR